MRQMSGRYQADVAILLGLRGEVQGGTGLRDGWKEYAMQLSSEHDVRELLGYILYFTGAMADELHEIRRCLELGKDDCK